MKTVNANGRFLKTVTPEELKEIQKMQSDFTQMKMRIADLELEKQAVFAQLNQMRMQFQINEKALIDKYGEDSIINIQTGEVTQKKVEPELIN